MYVSPVDDKGRTEFLPMDISVVHVVVNCRHHRRRIQYSRVERHLRCLRGEPPPGGIGQGEIRGGEGRGVIVIEVDQHVASVLLQGAYHWFRYQGF